MPARAERARRGFQIFPDKPSCRVFCCRILPEASVIKDVAFSFTLGFRGQLKVCYLCRKSVPVTIGVWAPAAGGKTRTWGRVTGSPRDHAPAWRTIRREARPESGQKRGTRRGALPALRPTRFRRDAIGAIAPRGAGEAHGGRAPRVLTSREGTTCLRVCQPWGRHRPPPLRTHTRPPYVCSWKRSPEAGGPGGWQRRAGQRTPGFRPRLCSASRGFYLRGHLRVRGGCWTSGHRSCAPPRKEEKSGWSRGSLSVGLIASVTPAVMRGHPAAREPGKRAFFLGGLLVPSEFVDLQIRTREKKV